MEEIEISYWSSYLLFEWSKGSWKKALKISEQLVKEIPEEGYYSQRGVISCYIQLLIMDRQYDKAEQLIFFMWELVSRQISDIGYGNLFIPILMLRFLLSMYIQIQKENGGLHPGKKESEMLLEKIIFCKTIEREIKSAWGRGEQDEAMDLYYFKQAHRKLAALQMGFLAGKFEKFDYEKKRAECLLEMTEHGCGRNKNNSLQEKIQGYSVKNLKIPSDAFGIEYFAYYNFRQDAPILMAEDVDGEEAFSFLAVTLSEEKGKVVISEITDIQTKGEAHEAAEKLLEATIYTEEYTKEEITEAVAYLRKLFSVPVKGCLKDKKLLYLGLDYILQLLPMDLFFCDEKGEPLQVILSDSLRYAGKDIKVDMETANALIVGRPKLNLQAADEENDLPCTEEECAEIARLFRTKAYTGREAKQRVLWGKEPKDVIHIAAHGKWLETDERTRLYDDLYIASFLKLAGYEEWEEGRENKDYGNGMLLGDDLLFMDLRKTKLVVLSACVSGLGEVKGLDGIHGMRWAAGTAGAESSVTTLWEVEDSAGAILMILFYRVLRILPVGKALYEAKRQLRSMTLADLKKDDVCMKIVKASKSERLQAMTDNDIPYAHWKYWAGFVCYQ